MVASSPPSPLRTRRALLRGSLAAGALGALGGCARMIPYDMQPGSLKSGARVHAFQTASIAYSFMAGHVAQWRATIRKVEQDTPALMGAVREAGHAMQIVVTPRQSNPERAAEDQYEYYDVDLLFVPATVDRMAVTKTPRPAPPPPSSTPSTPAPGSQKNAPKTRAPAPPPAPPPTSAPAPAAVALRGRAGTAEADYQRTAESVGKTLGLDPATLRRGHFAVYGLVNMLTALNVSNDALQRHAFALLVLREKAQNGEKVDWLAPNRPTDDTLMDIEVALRVIADHHATLTSFRTEIMGTVAMVNGYRAPDAVELLRGELAESQLRNEQWTNTRHQPRAEEYGVAMNDLTLPTPGALLERLDQSGYLSAAVTVAKGLATGSASTTLEGLTKLAPRDSTVRTVLEGLAASSRGDLLGAADAVRKLAGKTGRPLTERLTQLNSAVGSIKGGAAQVASALGKPPSDLDGLKNAAQNLDAGASRLQDGARQLPP